jgi:hypothetical protein
MKAEYNISKTVGHDDWRGMRLILDGEEGETPKELMNRTRQELDEWFFANFGGGLIAQQIIPTIIPEIPVEKVVPEGERMQIIIADIEKCTTIPKPEGIDSYYSLAKQHPSVMAAYEKRKSELVKKETAEILAATEANCLKKPPKKL